VNFSGRSPNNNLARLSRRQGRTKSAVRYSTDFQGFVYPWGRASPNKTKGGKDMATLAERFWVKVEKTDGCWLWKGSASGKGGQKCGYIGVNGRLESAPKVSWQLVNGPIPEGKWILHTCDNRLCVRPEHLYLGDASLNALDRWQRNPKPPKPIIHGTHNSYTRGCHCELCRKAHTEYNNRKEK